MLGDVPPATFNVSLQYTPLIATAAHPHYYVARLENMAVNGSVLPVDQVGSARYEFCIPFWIRKDQPAMHLQLLGA